MTGSLFSQIAREAVSRGHPLLLGSVRMTPREHQVIDLIAERMINKAVARELRISSHTVKSHVRNILEKLALHSRLQVAMYARDTGPSPREDSE
jgi:two-component system NarL family response regulator